MNYLLSLMNSVLNVMNSYSSLVSAVATVVIAILTIFLWLENRRLREAGEMPEVVAYLFPHSDGNGAVNFVLANVGRGPAFEVNFEFTYDEDDFHAHRALLFNDSDRMPITVLPQNEELRCLLGISFQLYGNFGGQNIGPLKPFDVNIRYKHKHSSKKVTERTRRIDIRQFASLRGTLSKSNDRKAVEALEKIEGHLGKLSKQAGRFNAFVDITEIKDSVVQKTSGDPGASG